MRLLKMLKQVPGPFRHRDGVGAPFCDWESGDLEVREQLRIVMELAEKKGLGAELRRGEERGSG